MKNAPINVVACNPSLNGLVTYTGTSRANVSILSLGVKFKLDEPPPAIATPGNASRVAKLAQIGRRLHRHDEISVSA